MIWQAGGIELGTIALAVVVLLWDLFGPRRAVFALAGLGLAALLAGSFLLPTDVALGPAYVQDAFALLVKRVMLAAALLAVVGLAPHASRRGALERSGEAIVLLLFAAVGGMALASAREWITLFVAFELLSLPLYVLTGLEKDKVAVEGALKIFLFGSVSSAVLLLGIALAVAASGTTFWMRAAWTPHDPVAALAFTLILAGFGFKIAAFPFSLWVPDAYQAAPAPVVAFLSVAPKAAAVAALFRLSFEVLTPAGIRLQTALSILAAASMIIGNLLALRQKDLKRLLAFSGIAQIGYVLLALAAGTSLGAGLALFFFLSYLLGNGGAFLVVTAIEAAGEEATLHGCRSLVRRAPLLAGALVVFLLSLGGIPFVLGFWGKLYVLLAAAQAGLWWLVVLAALLAVVALYYYLNVARYVLIVPDDGPPIATATPLLAAILLSAALLTVAGVFPQRLVDACLAAAPVTVSQSR